MSGVNIKKPTCDVAIATRGGAVTMCPKPVSSWGYAGRVYRYTCADHSYILTEDQSKKGAKP